MQLLWLIFCHFSVVTFFWLETALIPEQSFDQEQNNEKITVWCFVFIYGYGIAVEVVDGNFQYIMSYQSWWTDTIYSLDLMILQYRFFIT